MSSRTILFISNHLPRDFVRDVQGGFQRMRMFIDASMCAGLNIHFFFFVLSRESLDVGLVRKNIKEFWGIDATVELCPMSTLQRSQPVSFWQYYVAPALSLRNDSEYGPLCGRDQLRILSSSLSVQPAAIFVFGLESMLPLTLLEKRLPPTYFDLNDIEHKKATRTLGTLRARKGTWLRYLKVPAIIRAERAAIALSAKTFVCSDADKAYLEKKFGRSNICTIPNAVDFAVRPGGESETKTVLFLGSLAYPPNNAAVELLVTAIWPLVMERVPDARLLIVGPGGETVACRQSSPPSVDFVGFVRDVEPYYSQARVICCPIMVGGGTRIKLIEAAAYGKAIVSTTIGAEGLDFQDGVHALIRDTPESIAEACVDLLLDAARATILGESARAFASVKYSRQFVVEKICRELSS
jgi:glycosyltransferase involved in cell wall biosynthesis